MKDEKDKHITPKDLANAEQSLAALRDLLPSALFSFHKECLNQGFTLEQADSFTIIYLKLLFARA